MSAPSQPPNSQMKVDSTNSKSPGGVLSDGLAGTKPKVFDENGAVGGAFTGMFRVVFLISTTRHACTDSPQKMELWAEPLRRLAARWTRTG
jgi:hypothetical protein